jgi:hypothetical protein
LLQQDTCEVFSRVSAVFSRFSAVFSAAASLERLVEEAPGEGAHVRPLLVVLCRQTDGPFSIETEKYEGSITPACLDAANTYVCLQQI